MTTQDERIATLEADARIKAANLELVQARVAELEAQNKALYDQMSMMAQYGKPPAQPDHQGHSCTHKCTWPQCEAAQAAPAQEPQPVSNTDELPQRLSDERIMHFWDIHAGMPTEKYPLNYKDVRAFARAIEAAIVPPGYVVVPVQSLRRWRDAFAEELAGYDIDPPIHHVKTSHDEINTVIEAAPKASHDPR